MDAIGAKRILSAKPNTTIKEIVKDYTCRNTIFGALS